MIIIFIVVLIIGICFSAASDISTQIIDNTYQAEIVETSEDTILYYSEESDNEWHELDVDSCYYYSIDEDYIEDTSEKDEASFDYTSDVDYRNPYEIIEAAISNKETHICLVDEEIVDLHWIDVHAMSYSSFWLKSVTSNEEYYSNNHICRDYYFEYYDLSQEEIDSMKSEVDDVVLSIISNIPVDATDFDKCLIVHDEMIKRVTYDHSLEREHIYDLYGTLCLGFGVCEGYASAYCHIMKILGIPCQLVNSETHAWCKLGNSNCYVDVTWDDYDAEDKYGNTIISYYFFCIGEEICQIDDHEIENYSYNWSESDLSLPYYFEKNNWILSYYDYDSVVEIIIEQVQRGVVMPTILFSNEVAYEECKERMQTDFWPMISDTGYSGPSEAIYQNDDTLTWGFN